MPNRLNFDRAVDTLSEAIEEAQRANMTVCEFLQQAHQIWVDSVRRAADCDDDEWKALLQVRAGGSS